MVNNWFYETSKSPFNLNKVISICQLPIAYNYKNMQQTFQILDFNIHDANNSIIMRKNTLNAAYV